MAQKITNKTTDLQIGSVLKAINIKENTPYSLNKFYYITDGDGVGALFVGGYSIEFTMHDLGNYFEHIKTLDDIEELENKALILKESYTQFKTMYGNTEESIAHETLIEETIAFLVNDEVYKGNEVELRFICDNMDISMVEKCSCCGIFISPEDECYSDANNDGKPLCDSCSVYDEENNIYISKKNDELENLAYENKRMGDFLELLGLSLDNITDMVINGDENQIKEAINLIKIPLVFDVKNQIAQDILDILNDDLFSDTRFTHDSDQTRIYIEIGNDYKSTTGEYNEPCQKLKNVLGVSDLSTFVIINY